MDSQPQYQQSRAEWMANTGRDIYTEWMVGLLNEASVENIRNKSIIEAHFSDPNWDFSNKLTYLAKAISLQLSYIDETQIAEHESVLEDHFYEIKHYTSLTDIWNNPKDTPENRRNALVEHNVDSLGFAVSVTYGLAHRWIEELNGYSTTDLQSDDNTSKAQLVTTLRNPTFHKAAEDFAKTGFNMYVGHNTAEPLVIGGLRLEQFEDTPFQEAIDGEQRLFVDSEELSKVALTMNIKRTLSRLLKNQNTSGMHNDSSIVSKFDRYVSSGCPVRRIPARSHENSEHMHDKTAIAMLSDYLADAAERFL
jgi:hypothetical protein